MTIQQILILALQTSIVLTVFGFGLQATWHDVLYLARRPSLLSRSLLAMFLFVPLVAMVLARVFDLKPSVEIALVALSISPVPPLLPKKETKKGGHESYALALMVVASVLAIVVVPLATRLIGAYVGRPFAMPAAAVARLVVTFALLPLLAGMALRGLAPAVAERLAKPVGLLATVLLAVGVVAILIAALPSALALAGGGTLVAMVAFALAGLSIGHLLGGPRADHQVVLAFSSASRHPGIALAIAKANFPDEPALGATILLYLLVIALVGTAFMAWHRRHDAAAVATA